MIVFGTDVLTEDEEIALLTINKKELNTNISQYPHLQKLQSRGLLNELLKANKDVTFMSIGHSLKDAYNALSLNTKNKIATNYSKFYNELNVTDKPESSKEPWKNDVR